MQMQADAIEIKSIEAGNGLNATVEAGKEYVDSDLYYLCSAICVFADPGPYLSCF